MMDDEAMKAKPRKKSGKLRGFLWFLIVVVLVAGAGFVATRGDLSLAETFSNVRDMSEDATQEIRSTVDSAVRTDAGDQELEARLSDLETRLSDLDAKISFLEETLRQEPKARDGDEQTKLVRRVEFELFSAEAFDLEAIDVTVADGTVTLAGVVRSPAEHQLAQRITEEVPGVTKVKNELRLESSDEPTRSDERTNDG